MADGGDHIVLIDLDGTVADYDAAASVAPASLRAPGKPSHLDRDAGGATPPHLEARRTLVQRQPGFWRRPPRVGRGSLRFAACRQAPHRRRRSRRRRFKDAALEGISSSRGQFWTQTSRQIAEVFVPAQGVEPR
jgi:hypothetical protein